MAGLAKILKGLLGADKCRPEYTDRFYTLAKPVAVCQQPENHQTRSMPDPLYAPRPETSGTASFTCSLQWEINNGFLDTAEYQSMVEETWKYFLVVTLQPDGKVGHVQPIGEKAMPDQAVDTDSTSNFGVDAFLLAACKRVRYLNK